MTAKYSADSEGTTTQWDSDTRHVLAEWSDTPFQGHRHRHERVEHRVVVVYHDGVGVDIAHQARSEDTERLDDEAWTRIEAVEVREYGAQYDRRPEARWFA